MFVTASCNAQNQTAKDTAQSKNTNVQEHKPTASKYKIGQMWSCKTRPDEKDSYFIVVKIDANEKLGNIIHIALRNLKMKNPNSPDGISDGANHLPFSEKAISESEVKLLKEKVDLPNFEEGYEMWKEAFNAKRAGIYTTTIAKVVDVMEKGLNQ